MFPEGYVHASAGRLLDGRGEPLMLRGVGLGNWLLPEGYMWKFEHPRTQSPREIEAFIEDLVGPDLAADFWDRFRASFIAEDDIAQIKAEGMNHVRLPINSRMVMDGAGGLVEQGFALIDRVIDWCREHELWVVLDLHGAPGGQTGTNIDDSPNRAPELFTDARYRAMTVKLWRSLALRYRNEPVVAAYDLLNEPLPNQFQHLYVGELRDLYQELTAAIREVDRNHAISYEGTHWATNWDLFTEVWDPNSILQFHKYWSAPDRPSIQRYIDVGRELDLPVYMGEGGENDLDWIQTAFLLLDDSRISWTFWTWKKIDTLTSPCSVNAPQGWNAVTSYAAGTGARPDTTIARRTLDELLDAMPLSRCTYRHEVISALFRRPPLRIPAFAFGFRGNGESYQTSDAVPSDEFRSDDMVTMRSADGGGAELDWDRNAGAGRAAGADLLVSLGVGDWVAYDIAVRTPSRLRITASLQPNGKSSRQPRLDIAIDGKPVGLKNADGSTLRGTSGRLSAGPHVVRLTGQSSQTLVRSVELSPLPPS